MYTPMHTRTTTQSKVHIGDIIRNAVVFNLRNWSEDTMDTISLLQSVKRLFKLLDERQAEYVLVGGVALLHYVDGRNTEDIDLIMAFSSLDKLPEIQIISQDVYFVRGQFNELQIDILLTKNPLFDKVKTSYSSIQHFMEQDIPTATVEGLLLLKLYALPSLYRQGNFSRIGIFENDIATLIHYYQPSLAPLFDELVHHLSRTDLSSLQDIVVEIQQRIARFRKHSNSPT